MSVTSTLILLSHYSASGDRNSSFKSTLENYSLLGAAPRGFFL